MEREVKKFKTSKYTPKIEEVECLRETEMFVVIASNGLRTSYREKKDGYNKFHDTMKDALDHNIKKWSERLEYIKRETNSCNSELHQLQKLRDAL